MKKDLKTKITYTTILLVSILFYLFWYFNDGVIMAVDGASYINMETNREPGYCSFLWILRSIFGVDYYLNVVVVIQCVVAGIAAYVLTVRLKERFELKWGWAVCILLCQYGITLLNRFVAKRRYSYSCGIQTEGLTYSLWIFFFVGLIGIVYDKDKKSIAKSLFWAVILVSIRKHMLISFGMIFLCLVYVWWNDKKWLKTLMYSFLIIVVGFAGTKLIDCTYNFAQRGIFAPHTGDSSFIFGTEMYLANENMASYISSDTNRELFLKMLDMADKSGYNTKYRQGNGWHDIEDHYSECYDRIKFDVVNVIIREYQEELGIPQEDREESSNEILSAMMKDLIVPCMPGLIRLFACNVISGLITTVLKVHKYLNVLAVLLYIAYLTVLIWLVKKKAYKRESNSVIGFAILVLLAIALNVGLTSATIYCQMRYMLYNTALFYQAGLLMLIEAGRIYKMEKLQ
jgi:hypothetical protein